MQDEKIKNQKSSFVPSRRIFVPIDGSKTSLAALEFILSKLATKEDLIILVNVKHNLYNHEDLDFCFSITEQEMNEQENIAKLQSNEMLKEFAKVCENQGIESMAVSATGETRQRLEEMVAELNADFVVVGKRGLGTFASVLLGSVSDHLVHHLKVPVMIV
jgi:nucleotide-binding universal stress UspA family protein